MHQLCQAIAEALGPEWSSRTEERQSYCSYLIQAGGMRLFCLKQPQNRLKIETDAIEGISQTGRIFFRYYRDMPSITVSTTRSPEAIACDLRARLLPKATAWWKEGTEGKAKAEQEEAHRLQRHELKGKAAQ